jgi:Flp pilus assembly protein TadD
MLKNNDPERQVVPRWRSAESAMQFRELAPLSQRPSDAFSDSMLDDALEDWKREPGLSVACDVISGAFVIGRAQHSQIQEISRFVLADGRATPAARRIAAQCLALGDGARPAGSSIDQPIEGPLSDVKSAIGGMRRRLREYPVNPILWTNLALAYTTLGAREKASRAMRVALDQAPGHRFIVRAASRLFLHQGDIDRAHAVLARSPSVSVDPWTMASEIAVAAVQGRPSRLLSKAKRVIEARNHSPLHLSELASTLATIEADAGSAAKAKKLCAFSLQDPAENAIAQAAWLERKKGIYVRALTLPQEITSSEAEAWSEFQSARLERACEAAKAWQFEQPFSSRPANLGSYLYLLRDDFRGAETILRLGRASNREDPMLGNNLAFALANQGRLENALTVLSEFYHRKVDPIPAICLTATAGLISFRAGDAESGRRLYQRAIEMADRSGASPSSAMAKVYWAIEELRARSADIPAKINEAREAAESLPAPLKGIYLGMLARAEKAATATPRLAL